MSSKLQPFFVSMSVISFVGFLLCLAILCYEHQCTNNVMIDISEYDVAISKELGELSKQTTFLMSDIELINNTTKEIKTMLNEIVISNESGSANVGDVSND